MANLRFALNCICRWKELRSFTPNGHLSLSRGLSSHSRLALLLNLRFRLSPGLTNEIASCILSENSNMPVVLPSVHRCPPRWGGGPPPSAGWKALNPTRTIVLLYRQTNIRQPDRLQKIVSDNFRHLRRKTNPVVNKAAEESSILNTYGQ